MAKIQIFIYQGINIKMPKIPLKKNLRHSVVLSLLLMRQLTKQTAFLIHT